MRWVSYFPEIHNLHLTKDVGLIPFYMQEVAGYDAALLGRFPEKEYPALEGEVQGLEIIKLEDRGTISFLEKAAMDYIKKYAKRIDILQLSHLSRHTLLYGLIYKRHNPGGQLYIKLDAYNDDLRKRKKYARSKLKNAVLSRLERRFFKVVDLISIENKEGIDIAQQTYPEWSYKLIYIPLGANDRYLKKHFQKPVPKENLIISVGRIGSAEKNYDLLIRCLPFLKLGDWKIILIGDVTPEFQQAWTEISLAHPAVANQISFTGNISNRLELYGYYQKSRVFFLPSRVESFGISFVEALYFGNLLVGHGGMYAYGDLSDQGRHGTYFEDNDPTDFAEAIHRAMAMTTTRDNELAEEIARHGAKEFHWTSIAERLQEALAQRRLGEKSKI